MSFLQVILADDNPLRAGAAIRNAANFAALSHWSDGEVVHMQFDPKPRRGLRHPTVAALLPAEIARLLDRIEAGTPALVLFEGVNLLRAIEAVRRAYPRLPLIVDFHNVESRLHAEMRLSRTAPVLRPATRLRLARRFHAARQADVLAGRLADAVWTCSEPDAAEASVLGIERPIAVVANPIPDWCRMDEQPGERPRSRTVLFVGHLGYAPNHRAAAELAQSIVPALRRRIADAELHVCGREPGPDLLRALGGPGVRLTADPPDVAPFYRDAAVAAMPIRQGGGTRIKALEALAAGCPIVATGKAVEGLGLEPERHYLAAETTLDFVAALARLFEDAALGQRLAQDGRLLVERRYGEAARAAAIGDALRALKLG